MPGGKSNLTVRSSTSAELEQILQHLDQQFVLGRGRKISLSRRFPGVFCTENSENIFLLEDAGNVLSVLASRFFCWTSVDRAWRGAMIGAVYTVPEHRRKGLASSLLNQAIDRIRAQDAEFAVLWTDQRPFYAQLGWSAGDRGVLGKSDDLSPDSNDCVGDVVRMPAQAADIEVIESIRSRYCRHLIRRTAQDYRSLPLPVESVDILLWGSGTHEMAYALVGRGGPTDVLYEMIGNPEAYSKLWACARRGRIVVNEVRGSATQAWLAEHTNLIWEDKRLAMWLPLTKQAEKAELTNWYIPFFDRI